MASISPPTSLATFSNPHASSSKSASGRAAQHVVLGQVVGEPRWGLAAVQGDGIWTYDLSTLRPITSFTVPPATTFTTPALSYYSRRSVDKQKQKDQLMDIDRSPEDDSKESYVAGKSKGKVEKVRITVVGVRDELWVWTGEDGEKDVVKLPAPAQAIHHPHLSSSSSLFILTSPSKLYFLDESFALQPIDLPSLKMISEIASSKVISSSGEVSRLIIVDQKGRVALIKITLDERRAEKVSEGWIVQGKRITAVDISEEGVITALDSGNNLYSRELRDIASITTTVPQLVHPSTTPTLVSLASAGKPLVILPTPHPTPSLLLAIPLPSLPAILASTPISSFSTSGTISHLGILSRRGGSYTLGVVLSHDNGDGESGRSVVYTCEVTVPEKGVGMSMLLGTQEKTSIYLSTASSQGQSKSRSKLETAQDEIVTSVSAALQKGDVKSAEDQWKSWIESQESRQGKASLGIVLSEKFVRRLVNVVLEGALNDDGKLQTQGVYISGVLRDLVERGVVNDRMWKDGVVVDGLILLSDWDTILLAIRHIPTLTPSTLITLLRTSLHPTPTSTLAPAVGTLLREILALPPPAPTYRLELRRGLSAEDATAILAQYVKWAEEHVSQISISGLKGWDSPQTQSKSQSGKATVIPEIADLINHSSLLLDAHLPSFLSAGAEEAHDLLLRLQDALDPLLAAQKEYRALRAPVQAVLTLSQREARKKEEREKQKSKTTAAGMKSGGKGKGGKEDQGGHLPEEAIGKWKVEDLVF